MRFINDVYLLGTIGRTLAYKRASTGNEFATFSLLIEPSTRNGGKIQYIRVMVFEKKLVEKMKRLGVKPNMKAFVTAYLNSHKTETRGIEYITNDVIARSIDVVVKSGNESKRINEEVEEYGEHGELQE